MFHYCLIKIQNNDDRKHFVIDISKMGDHRVRVSILHSYYAIHTKKEKVNPEKYKGKFVKYNDIYAIFGTDYSHSVVWRGCVNNYAEIKEKKKEMIAYYNNKFDEYEKRETYPFVNLQPDWSFIY